MKLLILAGLLAIPSHSSCNPPARYDYNPKTYYVLDVKPNEMLLICGRIALGCTVNRKYIFLRSDLSPQARACTLRHEKGHVNGWPGNHPAT